jgi:hypothetical protein
MRFNVSHLLKAAIGARDVVHLSVGTVTLSADLVLHYLHGDIAFTRTSNGLLAEGRLVTELDSECVRCLTTVPLSFTFQLEDPHLALPQAPSRVSEYRTEHGWVDTTQALREQILLNIPEHSLPSRLSRFACNVAKT